mmetsp:Transcript_7807/g.17304  ORF Transcript_7807/g.17304 Transcript_7807/m.17304 type:complete len:245 (-) Transcript_7807:275-1009(-)
MQQVNASISNELHLKHGLLGAAASASESIVSCTNVSTWRPQRREARLQQPPIARPQHLVRALSCPHYGLFRRTSIIYLKLLANWTGTLELKVLEQVRVPLLGRVCATLTVGDEELLTLSDVPQSSDVVGHTLPGSVPDKLKAQVWRAGVVDSAHLLKHSFADGFGDLARQGQMFIHEAVLSDHTTQACIFLRRNSALLWHCSFSNECLQDGCITPSTTRAHGSASIASTQHQQPFSAHSNAYGP